MPIDTFLDNLTSHIRDFIPASITNYFSGGTPDAKNTLAPVKYAPFNRSHDFVIQNSTIAERIEYISSGKTVLDLLHPHTNPDAAMDSSARDPPPRCHPGTRININEKLIGWLDILGRDQDMQWLYGPAGTGKSAIAQTFAEACFEMVRLGGTFFFSRPNGRDKPETVVPSLVYQLCINCEAYKTIIASVLANDPQLLQKAISVQFKRLIIEPLSKLQADGHPSVRQPFIILLDGLDECAGAQSQCQFIKLISETVRLKRDFPILWLLCSRPEPHLKHTFSRIPECGHEELLLDRESHEDVTRFLRDKFAEIRDENPYTTTPDWPPEAQFDVILRVSSGHFQVATVAVNYVNDAIIQDPVKQLNTLVTFLEGAEKIGIDNPLAALDLIYTRILSEIPDRILPITRQILALLLFPSRSVGERLRSAQTLCNFLRLEKNMFYSALSRLHSVVRVPAPEDAYEKRLSFYHASFGDYLRDPIRSGKFALKDDWAFEVVAKTYLDWYQVLTVSSDSDNSGITGERRLSKPAFLPGLTWSPAHLTKSISSDIIKQVHKKALTTFKWGLKYKNDKLLVRLRDIDFQPIPQTEEPEKLGYLVRWILNHYPSDDIVRAEPSNDVDFQLLEYIKLLTKHALDVEKANILFQFLSQEEGSTLPEFSRFKEFFFVGCGQRAILSFITDCGLQKPQRIELLKAGNPPSEEQISEYQAWLDKNWAES
ncbi:hypothetical protein D9756_008260 [Leucocoprinus leucothites]|uniref:Nephrocystin 3-like N-terminal domain-containing protein n=1 Tax=Leucocoprinus leucothites TaxID=201217 RepID=A0A8H5D072_9AGAR|nr:hypothetical protein D9756_008260 [Leucoagaricus leucothites]